MRLPFLRRKEAKTDATRSVAPLLESDAVELARTRARRRLTGAVVLMGVGVVGFPVLFETQPRPLPVDTPIELARSAQAGVASGARAASGLIAAPVAAVVPSPAETGTEVTAAAPAGPAPDPQQVSLSAGAASANAGPAPAPSAPTSRSTPVALPPAARLASKADSGVDKNTDKKPETKPRAQANVAVGVAPEKSRAEAGPAVAVGEIAPRYVVQVGAYNDDARMREARQKVERIGFKTYTSEVDSPTGRRTRVRLGPFVSKEEAQAAAAKVKDVGLPANVLTL